MLHRIEQTQVIARPLADVFPFFADAANLGTLTPDTLEFKILTPLPVEMREGALIDYRIRLFGVPLRWRTRIEEWEPGRRFVDVQLAGPYKRWRHTHEFRAVEGGTEMHDLVEYELPLGPLGAIAYALFVRRTLVGIFDFRRRQVASLFDPARAATEQGDG